MSGQTKSPIHIVAGVLFALMALVQLRNFVRELSYAGFWAGLSFLMCAAYLLLAIALFLRRRDLMMIIALSALCLTALFYLIFSNGPLFFLRNFVHFAATASLLLLCLSQLTAPLSAYRGKLEALWFLPAAIHALAIPISFFISAYQLRGFAFFYGFQLSLTPVLGTAAYFFLSWYLASFAEGAAGFALPGDSADAHRQSHSAPLPPAGDGYFNLLAHVVLLLFTFGIWYLIWIYRTTEYLNRVQDEPYRSPVSKLLLCIFIPFYSIYWIYQSARRVDRLAAQHGVYSDLTTFCLVLAFFVGTIPPAFLQEKINTIAMVESGAYMPPGSGNPAAAPEAGAANTTSAQTVGQIRAYKELLDSGAITLEEYNAKKQQLLGF